MAETHPEADAATAADGVAEKPASKKKLIILILIPVLLIAVAGGLFASGIIGGHKKTDKTEQGEAQEEEEHTGPSVFLQLPDMIINLNGDNGKQRFLKLSITLELYKTEDQKAIEAVLPRVTDHFQTYLRELRLDDLRGSAGIYRLRQELLDRVRGATDGIDVKDVLFEEILVQ